MTDIPETAEKDPDDWVTGDEPATGPQLSYLSTLAHQAGEEVETDGLTKADASRLIDDLPGADRPLGRRVAAAGR